jgi:iron(III) transport system permease protein
MVQLGLPLMVLVAWSFRGGWTAKVLGDSAARLGESLVASAPAAVVAAVAALPIAWLSVRRGGRRAAMLERATYTGFLLPGIVVALSLVLFTVGTALYQSLPLLVGAYVVLFLPQAVGATRSSLLQVDRRLEEAGRTLGHDPGSVFRRVTLPLLAPGILAGALLVFLTSMKELPATLILGPTGFSTLATRIWGLTEDVRYAPAAVDALVLVAASVVVLFLAQPRSRRGKMTA